MLTEDFKSHDPGISASNLRRDRKNPMDIHDRIDLAAVTDNLRKLLEIRNKSEQKVELDDVHAAEIKEYLDLSLPKICVAVCRIWRYFGIYLFCHMVKKLNFVV